MSSQPFPRDTPLRFHDLRHTTATLLFQAGVDPYRVQRILRHSDVRVTTMVYGHLVVDDLREAVAKLPSMPMLAPPTKPVALLPPPKGEKRVAMAIAARRASSRTLTVAEVAAELKVCTAIVYRMCATGKLPHFRVSNSIRIRVEDLPSVLPAASADLDQM